MPRCLSRGSSHQRSSGILLPHPSVGDRSQSIARSLPAVPASLAVHPPQFGFHCLSARSSVSLWYLRYSSLTLPFCLWEDSGYSKSGFGTPGNNWNKINKKEAVCFELFFPFSKTSDQSKTGNRRQETCMSMSMSMSCSSCPRPGAGRFLCSCCFFFPIRFLLFRSTAAGSPGADTCDTSNTRARARAEKRSEERNVPI